MKNSLSFLALLLLPGLPAIAQASKASKEAASRPAVPVAAAAPVAAPATRSTSSAAVKRLQFQDANQLPSYELFVSEQKTTHLVFPFAVTYVDLGTDALLAAKAEGAQNVVKLKAARTDFMETNMTVLTSDGKLYSFIVNYQAQPKTFSIDMGAGVSPTGGIVPYAQAAPAGIILEDSPIPEGNLEMYARKALGSMGTIASENKFSIAAKAGSVYYREETMFFPLVLSNKSNVSYDIDFIKFYTEDKKKVKRMAEQQVELSPLFVFNGDLKKVEAQRNLEQCFIFRKFTIPDQKYLIIEIYEKGGGRNLKLQLTNRDLVAARAMN